MLIPKYFVLFTGLTVFQTAFSANVWCSELNKILAVTQLSEDSEQIKLVERMHMLVCQRSYPVGSVVRYQDGQVGASSFGKVGDTFRYATEKVPNQTISGTFPLRHFGCMKVSCRFN